MEGSLVYSYTGDLTLEGIHFRDGPVDSQSKGEGSLRLINCSFGPAVGREIVGGVAIGDKHRAAEIINCWAPGLVFQSLGIGSVSWIRNSVVGKIFAQPFGGGERRLAIEHSVVWNPGCGAITQHSHPDSAFVPHSDARLNVALDNTFVESARLLFGALNPRGLNEVGWKNARTFYRTGIPNLVERLRTECASGDEGSLAAPPFDFDPLQRRLLTDSPGYQAGPDGKDLGADVSRIAVTTRE